MKDEAKKRNRTKQEIILWVAQRGAEVNQILKTCDNQRQHSDKGKLFKAQTLDSLSTTQVRHGCEKSLDDENGAECSPIDRTR